MKVLTTLTVSGGLNMASNAQDTFTIGTPLEHNDGQVDSLLVYANADFKNNVILGSSSVDTVTINAGTVNLSGTVLTNYSISNLYVSKQGSDSNTGLAADSGSALLTIQAAVDKLATLNATTNNRELFHVTINIASGTYEEKVNIFNKGVGKSSSNLLVKFVGADEVLYSAVPTTGGITLDPDLGFDNSVQCGVQLVFTGSTPAQDSLKGCFLKSSDGYRTAVINSHSGSNFYINSIGFGYNDANQTVDIIKPSVEVKGLFRTAGVNGVIAFDTIRITGLDDGEDCIAFGGFTAPPTNLEYTSLDKYRSVSRDEIFAYNCHLTVTGTVDVVMPPNFQFVNGYVFSSENSNSQRLTLTNYSQADQLKIMGSLLEKVYFNLDGYTNVDFGASDFEDNTGAFYRIQLCNGPKKLKYTSVGNHITLGQTNVVFPANFISKRGYIIASDSGVTYLPSSYFIGPFNRIIDAYDTTVDFYYGGNGPPTGSHFFSGSLEADRFFILNQNSYLKVQGQLDLSNVNISGGYPPFYVYNSTVVYTHALPITASVTSSNYVPYDIQLDDAATYKYTDLPVVNQQGSFLDNRVVYYNIKTETKIPFTASSGIYLSNSSIYLTGSSTIYYQGNDFVDYVLNNIGGGSITSLESTGSGESLVRDVNNGTGSLRSLKSTSTINVIQQTNELELTVNPNLTLTSLTSQGTLVVSGNVQLGDQSSDTITIQGALKLSPVNSLPTGEHGRLAVSGSNLYFHNGTEWKTVAFA